MTQKVPQNFQEKISQRKSVPKVPKFLGVGVRPSLENTQIKAAFFFIKTSLRVSGNFDNVGTEEDTVLIWFSLQKSSHKKSSFLLEIFQKEP